MAEKPKNWIADAIRQNQPSSAGLDMLDDLYQKGIIDADNYVRARTHLSDNENPEISPVEPIPRREDSGFKEPMLPMNVPIPRRKDSGFQPQRISPMQIQDQYGPLGQA
jgi:hypothetical protein